MADSFGVWQKPTKFCKAIIFQLKNKKRTDQKKKKTKTFFHFSFFLTWLTCFHCNCANSTLQGKKRNMILPLTIKIFPLFTPQTKLCNIRLRKKCFRDPFETCSPTMSLFLFY